MRTIIKRYCCFFFGLSVPEYEFSLFNSINVGVSFIFITIFEEGRSFDFFTIMKRANEDFFWLNQPCYWFGGWESSIMKISIINKGAIYNVAPEQSSIGLWKFRVDIKRPWIEAIIYILIICHFHNFIKNPVQIFRAFGFHWPKVVHICLSVGVSVALINSQSFFSLLFISTVIKKLH